MIFFNQSNIPLRFWELNQFRFLLRIIYWGEAHQLQENNKILLVATEKTGHEDNAEKPEHIFLTCEGNVRRMS